MNFKMIYFPI